MGEQISYINIYRTRYLYCNLILIFRYLKLVFSAQSIHEEGEDMVNGREDELEED